MADDFLKALSTQLQSQFSIGENTTNTLDTVSADGTQIKYGGLGDFAKKIDQSAERKYLEQGFLRKDVTNIDANQFEILMQQPTATVLVKKRMLSSLSENYRPEYMDDDERIYFKSMKVLFQNKCRQIAALEKLSKIQKIASIIGDVDEQIMNVVFSLSQEFDNASGSNVVSESQNISSQTSLSGSSIQDQLKNQSGNSVSNFKSTVDTIRRLYAFNKSSPLTDWVTDNTNLFKSDFGEGTGVIEITNFSSFTAGTNLKGNGTSTLTISDPYEVMTITEYDIEKAMSDATNLFYNTKTYQFGLDNVEQLIGDLQARLSTLRNQRGASPIEFKINPDTVLGKRLTAIIQNSGVEILFQYNAFSQSALSSGLIAENPAPPTVNAQTGAIEPPPNTNYGVTISASYFLNGSIAGFDGLNATKSSGYFAKLIEESGQSADIITDSELTLFQQLVQAIYNKINLQQSSQNALQQSNQKLNYVRKKLRFNFLGKLIVQPMDTIHIYVSSKAKSDNKLLSGLKSMYTGLGYLQSVSGTLNGLQKQISLFESDNIISQIEKSVFVGPDFPHFLWAVMRPQFVNEKEGTHVFGGIVSTSRSAYANGSFTVTVNADDNFKYFSFGHVNFLPAVDKWNGAFYDPLTPFQTKFGTISTNYQNQTPKLLPENEVILASSNPFLKFKSGPNAGQPVTLGNYISDATVDPVTKRLTKTFHAPDGIVYKWKEGIGVYTFSGDSFNLNSPANVGTPSITTEPFASQDVMNCISLLITGIPYNFATYWQGVANFDGFARDPQSNRDASFSFYQSLQNDLRKRNALWGNFIPFKNLSMDEQSLRLKFNQFDKISNISDKLQEKFEELRDLNNKIVAEKVITASPDLQIIYESAGGTTTIAIQLQNRADQIYKDIQENVDAFSNLNSDSIFNQIGNDVSFDSDLYLYNADNKSVLPASRRILRRQVDFLTRRMSYNVRANQDKNLFIVDDFYDKDYDIAAFNKDLNNGAFQLYQNQFLTVAEKITAVANLLNLEVYCDTQGHIRARPPQYNRMPSSVFYRMMYQKKSLGIQIFPEFLDNIFNEQITTLKERVEILEDNIRLNAAALGYFSDQEVQSFVNQPAGDTSKTPGQPFIFLSNSDGNIIDFTALLNQANPDQSLIGNDTFVSLTSQVQNTKNLFTPFQRVQFIKDTFNTINQDKVNNTISSSKFNINSPVDFSKNERFNILQKRLEDKSGQKVTPNSFNYEIDLGVLAFNPLFQKYKIDVLKIINNVAEAVSERQKVLKLLYKTIINSKEFRSLDTDPSVTNKLLSQNSNPNQNVPEAFEHMIEDETFDDYGPGSGQRYIIRQNQIISYNISENPPEFTTVQVQGVLNEFDSKGGDTFAALPDNGNALVAARAVDFDLWRNYGLLTVQSVNVPFLTNPESQCAPFAVSLLSRARNNILRGTVSLVGNEYYQPGEVIYIEGKNLLFYVEAVSHSFTFGQNYTTELTLSYGHSPGEYIPTTLDIIGKMLYRNKQISTFRVQRETSNFNNASFGAIIFEPNKGFDNAFDGNSVFAPANVTLLSNMLNVTALQIRNEQVKGNNVKLNIELNVYYDSKANKSIPDPGMISAAEYIKNILLGNNKMSSKLAPNNSTQPITVPKTNSVGEDLVVIKKVDLSATDDYRSPSSKAMSAARSLASIVPQNKNKTPNNPDTSRGFTQGLATSSSLEKPDNLITEDGGIRRALFEYIVDCWVKIESLPPPLPAEEVPTPAQVQQQTAAPAEGAQNPTPPPNDNPVAPTPPAAPVATTT